MLVIVLLSHFSVATCVYGDQGFKKAEDQKDEVDKKKEFIHKEKEKLPKKERPPWYATKGGHLRLRFGVLAFGCRSQSKEKLLFVLYM